MAQTAIMIQPDVYCRAIATPFEQRSLYWIISKYSADNLDIPMAAATRKGLNT